MLEDQKQYPDADAWVEQNPCFHPSQLGEEDRSSRIDIEAYLN